MNKKQKEYMGQVTSTQGYVTQTKARSFQGTAEGTGLRMESRTRKACRVPHIALQAVHMPPLIPKSMP